MRAHPILWTALLCLACAACGDDSDSADASTGTAGRDASDAADNGPDRDSGDANDVDSGTGVIEPTDASDGSCRTAADCPEASPCKTPACIDHLCALENVADNTVIDAQVTGDCRTAVCDGEGNVRSVHDRDDVEADDLQCTDDRCSSGSVVHPDTVAGMPCSQEGGQVCDGRGACVECAWPSDCESEVCQGGQCRPSLCGNELRDGNESDVDCGNGCGPCGPEQACMDDADCAGMECNLELCVANCDDGVQNNDESDRDCGGGCDLGCDEGESCEMHADCDSGFCNPAFHECATPSCSDLFMNGDESGEDCGGSCPTCPAPCLWNDHCSAGDVCYQEFCAHAVNGCSIGTATDLTHMPSVTVEFGGAHGNAYVPNCIKVTMNSEVTFSGDFATHPLFGGHVRLGAKVPASEGPFVPMTSSGDSKTVTMSECSTFGFYCDNHALSGMTGAIFVVAP